MSMDTRRPSVPPVRRRGWPRWLLPGVAIAIVTAGLVVAGIVPLSGAVYAAALGGMILMHLGGHGHGGHASQGHSEPGEGDHRHRSPRP